MSDTDIDTETLDDIEASLVPDFEDDEDPGHHTHIVRPVDNGYPLGRTSQGAITAQEVVNNARILGYKVKALCGYEWVPKANPEKYPACGPCFEIAGQIQRGERF